MGKRDQAHSREQEVTELNKQSGPQILLNIRKMNARLQKPALLRLSLLLSVLVLLSGLVFCSVACSGQQKPDVTNPAVLPESSDFLSESALIQHLALAINGQEDLATAYQAIPQDQRKGLTEDEFQRYIRLLRRGLPDRVLSFSAMSPSDLKAVQEKMLTQLPQQRQLINSTRGYWLHFGNNALTTERLAIYCQVNPEGRAYLDRDWIAQVVRLGDFSNLYFDALDQQEDTALSELLVSTLPDQTAREFIAYNLINFYRYKVESTTDAFLLLEARIDLVSFQENLLVPIGPRQDMTRSVEFSPTPEGAFAVKDWLPDVLNEGDADIYFNDKLLIRVGGVLSSSFVTQSSSTLERKLGKPLLHDDSNCSVQENGQSLMRLSYQGIDLTILGECSDHYYWRGHVISATITDPSFRLGSGLGPGNPEELLYARYPFISVGQRSALAQLEGGTVELKASIESGFIKSLRLSVD